MSKCCLLGENKHGSLAAAFPHRREWPGRGWSWGSPPCSHGTRWLSSLPPRRRPGKRRVPALRDRRAPSWSCHPARKACSAAGASVLHPGILQDASAAARAALAADAGLGSPRSPTPTSPCRAGACRSCRRPWGSRGAGCQSLPGGGGRGALQHPGSSGSSPPGAAPGGGRTGPSALAPAPCRAAGRTAGRAPPSDGQGCGQGFSGARAPPAAALPGRAGPVPCRRVPGAPRAGPAAPRADPPAPLPVSLRHSAAARPGLALPAAPLRSAAGGGGGAGL